MPRTPKLDEPQSDVMRVLEADLTCRSWVLNDQGQVVSKVTWSNFLQGLDPSGCEASQH